jgi:pimeloyl-ACP methyl ester carboxylesterase
VLGYFDVRGIRLAAAVSGTSGATPLVLLHGGGIDSSTWAKVAPAFAATHQVYAVDQRGFGATSRGGPYGFRPMRDDVLGLLDVLGLQQCDLVGHSMGGTVAWLVAQQQPDRVAHLVAEDSPPPARGRFRSSVTIGQPPDAPFDWAAVEAYARELNSPDPQWWDRIDAVTAPTLLLAGGASSPVPQDLIGEALGKLRNGRIVQIPVGHNIHRDDPAAFTEAVTAFLRDTR